jgi:hypothetical protein
MFSARGLVEMGAIVVKVAVSKMVSLYVPPAMQLHCSRQFKTTTADY